MNHVPHGPCTLIFDFLVGSDVDALPLFQVSRKFSELVSERMQQRSPYPRRLFYNLRIRDIRVLSVLHLQWFLSQYLPRSSLKLMAGICWLGNLDAVKWLRGAGFALSSDAITSAAGGGHLEVVKWLHGVGCKLSSFAIASAAGGGHLEVVKWLREAGCEWNSYAITSGAGGGRLEVVKWLREAGCEWNSYAINWAARGGYLEVAKWLRENGCHWSSYAIAWAAVGGHLEVV